MELLHRLVWALLFVMCIVAGCGVRQVGEMLRLAGLAPFVACSPSYLARLARQMEAESGTFARQERTRLADEMHTRLARDGQMTRPITVCQDETFHNGRPCLVAIEPVSNFLVVETYAPTREAKAWDDAMALGLAGLPVRVVQSTSDEGKAVVAHATATLKAAHGSDIFHVQYELSRATSAVLQRQVNRATDARDKAAAATEAVRQEADAAARRPRRRGRPLGYPGRIAKAEAQAAGAQAAVDATTQRQEAARQARRGLSAAYHLVDLVTGKLRAPAQVEADLTTHLDTLHAVATEADLPGYAFRGIAKARRVLPTLVQSLTFVHQQLAAQVAANELTRPAAALVESRLLPAAYLARVARQLPTPEARHATRQLAHRLRAEAEPLLAVLDADQRTLLTRIAQDVADLFQRASSCVEGRNGQLALRHHSLHHLSDARLTALTAVHNFFLRRPDGTTAAERFFGAKPHDLFEHLLTHLDPPARPGGARQLDRLTA